MEEVASHLRQSASATWASHLQAANHIPSVLVAHTSAAQSALVATAEHVAGVASSSSAHLQGTAEQALVAAAHHVAADSAAQLRDAVVACQPDPRGAITARPIAYPSCCPT